MLRMLRVNEWTLAEALGGPRFVFLAGKQSAQRPGSLKLLKYLHLLDLLKYCRVVRSLGEKNNGVTAGASLPCSDTPVAPHCLQGEVQRPSLEFQGTHNRAPPCLSDLIVGFDLLPGQAQPLPAPKPQSPHLPGTWTGPVSQTYPPSASPLPRYKPSFQAQLKSHLFQEASTVLQPIPASPDLPQHLPEFCISIFKAVCQCIALPYPAWWIKINASPIVPGSGSSSGLHCFLVLRTWVRREIEVRTPVSRGCGRISKIGRNVASTH